MGHFHPHTWSANGGDLITTSFNDVNQGPDIVAMPFGDEPGEPRPVVATTAWEGASGAAVSPDGRWLAYEANPTGAGEIWVRPYPGPGAPVRVSPDGGVEPIWSRDGRELFYRSEDRMLSARLHPGADLRFDPPVVLFESSYFRSEFYQPPSYDVAADGRFLMLKWLPGTDPGLQPLVVVSNWPAEVERRSGR